MALAPQRRMAIVRRVSRMLGSVSVCALIGLALSATQLDAQTATPLVSSADNDDAPAGDVDIDRVVAAKTGDAEAQFQLGLQYENGDGIARDVAAALQWYRRAAEQGLPAGQRAVGVMYNFGQGVEQDYPKALEWYLRAAAAGDPIAENNIGVLYQRGSGVPVDYAAAVEWYRKSADH